MRIEIICTGDEILTGKTVNTNFSHMAQRIEDIGLTVSWGTTVGDDRDNLLLAFREASERADVVIVNGGLGPTVDDLSQEVAGEAAGVDLILNEEWMTHMKDYYRGRNRVMPDVNRKQAMLPVGAEVIDNPIGTACGFGLDIGNARFYFTPGVPRELHIMLEDQLIPRILAASGTSMATRLKRFHSFGIGESRADELLRDIDGLSPNGAVKLGFQSHFPQLETKLLTRGKNDNINSQSIAPIAAEIRRRYGNFIVSEDNETLESVIFSKLREQKGTLAIAENFTSGTIASRVAYNEYAKEIFKRGIIVRSRKQLSDAVGLTSAGAIDNSKDDFIHSIAAALRKHSDTTHGLVVLVDFDPGEDGIGAGGEICVCVIGHKGSCFRKAYFLGGAQWVRLGAAELGLDCLRRYLLDLPMHEILDFEKK